MNMKKFNHVITEQFTDLRTTNQNGSRYYETPEGAYPSVTTVTGWEKKKFFAEWRAKNPAESRRVLNRGNELHSLVEYYINNEFNVKEDKGRVALPILDLFLQLQPELDNIDNVYAQEVPLWSKTLELAGRVDCVGEYKGKLSIIDFKGSTKIKRKEDIENYFTQSTAYAIMWQEMTGISIDNIVIMIATEEGGSQVFEANPINYVKPLLKAIRGYQVEMNNIKSVV
jgi:genome maintenance exonuclease 1